MQIVEFGLNQDDMLQCCILVDVLLAASQLPGDCQWRHSSSTGRSYCNLSHHLGTFSFRAF